MVALLSMCLTSAAGCQDDDEPFREQLASSLEPEAAIRAGDERDAYMFVPHSSIL